MPVGQIPRRRGAGPMSTAVRETAANAAQATEARVEQRQKNAADAREYRRAAEPAIRAAADPGTDVPRDRLEAAVAAFQRALRDE